MIKSEKVFHQSSRNCSPEYCRHKYHRGQRYPLPNAFKHSTARGLKFISLQFKFSHSCGRRLMAGSGEQLMGPLPFFVTGVEQVPPREAYRLTCANASAWSNVRYSQSRPAAHRRSLLSISVQTATYLHHCSATDLHQKPTTDLHYKAAA